MQQNTKLQKWTAIVPEPKSRNLVVGSVGSGKSTLGCSLLDTYHRLYPHHGVYIIDPKHRFVPVSSEDGSLFPEGYTARNHGRIEGVATSARLVRVINRRLLQPGAYLIHSLGDALMLYGYLFQHADVRRPVMLYNDESMDQHKNGLLDYRMKRVIQMGREKGMGHITLNQRPKRIDVTLISESERLYVGTLHNVNDRKALADTVAVPDARRLLTAMPMHQFWMIDQVHPERSKRFTLKLAA